MTSVIVKLCVFLGLLRLYQFALGMATKLTFFEKKAQRLELF